VPVSPPLRNSNLERLAADVHDVLVVGAGINGAVAAAALASGGAATALIDRGDFAGGTSQESSNLVWGGIKYLEGLEFPLVWKLCRSRNELMRSYPASVRQIRFYVPIEQTSQGAMRAVPVLWAGAWLYWLMGRGFTAAPRLLTPSRIAREEPAIDGSLVKGGVEYSDACLVDHDARFVFGFVRDALACGAAVANYVEVVRCERDGERMWRCRAIDRVTGHDFEIRARVLVNAAGPHVDQLNAANGVRTSVRHLFSKGIHLVVDRITGGDHVLTFFDETDRMFFVIPMGRRSVIGTTDTRVERPESEVSDDDRRFLLENLNRRLRLERPLEPADVIAERCGVRPLVVTSLDEAEAQAWTSLSRRHVIEVDRSRRCISIFGGKLTDCLNVGDEVAELVRKLGVALPGRDKQWYGEPAEALRDKVFAAARRNGIDEELTTRLWRRYGADAAGMVEQVRRDPRLAEPVIEGTGYRRCELLHAARVEMVVRLEDLLRRRTRIALVHRRSELQQAQGLQEVCEALAADQSAELLAEYLDGPAQRLE
jgi:glycerol-3-phosphate dehydrogenase